MNLAELVAGLDLKVFAGGDDLSRAIGGGYVGDLMSDVIAHGRKDYLWITIQIHQNMIAVAVLKELAAIIIANGREPADEAVRLAEKERIPLLGTSLNAFEFVGRLYGLGVKGQ